MRKLSFATRGESTRWLSGDLVVNFINAANFGPGSGHILICKSERILAGYWLGRASFLGGRKKSWVWRGGGRGEVVLMLI